MSPQRVKKIKEFLLEQKTGLLSKNKGNNPLKEVFEPKGDIMDQATTEGKLKLFLSFQNRERHDLLKIERALERIENSTFGICKACEDKIPFKRLQINPITEFCVGCQEEQEADRIHSPNPSL